MNRNYQNRNIRLSVFSLFLFIIFRHSQIKELLILKVLPEPGNGAVSLYNLLLKKFEILHIETAIAQPGTIVNTSLLNSGFAKKTKIFTNQYLISIKMEFPVKYLVTFYKALRNSALPL